MKQAPSSDSVVSDEGPEGASSFASLSTSTGTSMDGLTSLDPANKSEGKSYKIKNSKGCAVRL